MEHVLDLIKGLHCNWNSQWFSLRSQYIYIIQSCVFEVWRSQWDVDMEFVVRLPSAVAEAEFSNQDIHFGTKLQTHCGEPMWRTSKTSHFRHKSVPKSFNLALETRLVLQGCSERFSNKTHSKNPPNTHEVSSR